jgi:hypothetical protein
MSRAPDVGLISRASEVLTVTGEETVAFTGEEVVFVLPQRPEHL